MTTKQGNSAPPHQQSVTLVTVKAVELSMTHTCNKIGQFYCQSQACSLAASWAAIVLQQPDTFANVMLDSSIRGCCVGLDRTKEEGEDWQELG